jgi:hypothetical protein
MIFLLHTENSERLKDALAESFSWMIFVPSYQKFIAGVNLLSP